jgi:hypothetical protein
VGNLQAVRAGNKLAAIPKTYGRLKGEDISNGSDDKAKPAEKVVDLIVLHWTVLVIVVYGAGKYPFFNV